jgi:hypothetical protein
MKLQLSNLSAVGAPNICQNVECGKIFNVTSTNQRYCSKACRLEANGQKIKAKKDDGFIDWMYRIRIAGNLNNV